VRYLLDVNTLIALGHVMHAHHQRAQVWQSGLAAGVDVLGTCAITELGFVRVSVQSGLQADIFTAQSALERLKATGPVIYELWPDGLGAGRLPADVRKPAELTDGHLVELARVQQAQLVTLDVGIPGALLIP
jgi:predicted nucleic acid-binding protein